MGLFGPKKKTEVVDPSTGEVVELKEKINLWRKPWSI